MLGVPRSLERVQPGAEGWTCQAERGTGGMPRCQRPMKDAERGETWTGSCMRAMSRPNPNGATPVRASGRTGT